MVYGLSAPSGSLNTWLLPRQMHNSKPFEHQQSPGLHAFLRLGILQLTQPPKPALCSASKPHDWTAGLACGSAQGLFPASTAPGIAAPLTSWPRWSWLCRGVGFVNYVDCAAAVRAAQLVHGTRIAEGRQVHVTLQVTNWLTGVHGVLMREGRPAWLVGGTDVSSDSESAAQWSLAMPCFCTRIHSLLSLCASLLVWCS